MTLGKLFKHSIAALQVGVLSEVDHIECCSAGFFLLPFSRVRQRLDARRTWSVLGQTLGTMVRHTGFKQASVTLLDEDMVNFLLCALSWDSQVRRWISGPLNHDPRTGRSCMRCAVVSNRWHSAVIFFIIIVIIASSRTRELTDGSFQLSRSAVCLSYHISIINQYDLVLAKRWWCSKTGKVRRSLAAKNSSHDQFLTVSWDHSLNFVTCFLRLTFFPTFGVSDVKFQLRNNSTLIFSHLQCFKNSQKFSFRNRLNLKRL